MSEIKVDALSHPLDFPPEFKSWLSDYVAMQIPKLPVTQVFGYQLQRVRTATVDTLESTTSTSYADLATVGPKLTQLANGFYLLVYGGDRSTSLFSADAYMAPSVNGAAASDADACTFLPGFSSSTAYISNLRMLMVQLNTPGGVNEITMKYRGTAGTQYFQYRFLHALSVISTDV